MADIAQELRNLRGDYRLSICIQAADEIERLRTLLDEATTNPEGDYYLGLRCGVEDRDIYDRYDAVEFGWDQAFEYVGSVVAGASVKATEGE